MPVRLQLLGTPTIDCDGESTALPFERRGQLVALLALRRSWVARTELAAMLWPDQEPKLAYSNLRKSLFRLQSLAWGVHLESQGGSLRFVADTDVTAFEQALREQRLADALAIHRGALLAGFDDDANDAEATTGRTDIGRPGRSYGYQRWTYTDGTFAARGIFGQGIFIDPKRKIVIASTPTGAQERATVSPARRARRSTALREGGGGHAERRAGAIGLRPTFTPPARCRLVCNC